jgi:hypothetical protein
LEKDLDSIRYLIIYGGCVVLFLYGLFPHFKARIANGQKPRENARRHKAYKEAVAAALKAAEPIKLAEDHRLKDEIRHLLGNSETVSKTESELRRLLSIL